MSALQKVPSTPQQEESPHENTLNEEFMVPSKDVTQNDSVTSDGPKLTSPQSRHEIPLQERTKPHPPAMKTEVITPKGNNLPEWERCGVHLSVFAFKHSAELRKKHSEEALLLADWQSYKKNNPGWRETAFMHKQYYRARAERDYYREVAESLAGGPVEPYHSDTE